MGELETALRAVRDSGGRAFVPYVTGGFPGVDAGLLRALADAGADAIEVGIPHSDPIMDGPVVQQASSVALERGTHPTDVLAMIAEADASGADWHLSYGGRTRSSMAYTDLLAGYGGRVTFAPADEVGLLDLHAILGTPGPSTLVYCCGPEPLLAAVENVCDQAWPADALRLERFAAKAAEAPSEGERAFELVLAGSGVTLEVPPDKSIFDVIQDAGISVLGSCHEGICGTCEQAVLEGDVDHRDSVLNESEQAANDAMMVCVSRCFSDRLVLDL